MEEEEDTTHHKVRSRLGLDTLKATRRTRVNHLLLVALHIAQVIDQLAAVRCLELPLLKERRKRR
jgi:hypothetical protein